MLDCKIIGGEKKTATISHGLKVGSQRVGQPFKTHPACFTSQITQSDFTPHCKQICVFAFNKTRWQFSAIRVKVGRLIFCVVML